MRCELIHSLNVENELGEGVIWNDKTQTLWWTDIEKQTLFSYDWRTKNIDTFSMPERLCSFALVRNSTNLLAAFETGLAFLNPHENTLEWIDKIYEKGSGIRLNDGRVDRGGRFWVGAMQEESNQSELSGSHLYSYSVEEGLKIHEKEVSISNSLSWGPDNKTLYFADSPKNEIYAFDFDLQAGSINNKRIFAQTKTGVHPDGSCVDKEGYLWNAQWGAGQVVRYAPNGSVDFKLDVPSNQPTCVAFAGPNLDHLCVTSARIGLTVEEKRDYPNSGALFIYKTDFTGLIEARFRH